MTVLENIIECILLVIEEFVKFISPYFIELCLVTYVILDVGIKNVF